MKINKKAIVTTILVIQLVLLLLLTFSSLTVKRSTFSNEMTVVRVAAFGLSSTTDAIVEDIHYLKSKGADNETINQYISFVNSTFNNYYNGELYLNQSYILIKDKNFNMQKESLI